MIQSKIIDFFFLNFKKSFWFPHSKNQNQKKNQNNTNNNNNKSTLNESYFEKEPENLSPTVQIQNLTKVNKKEEEEILLIFGFSL